MPFLPRITRRRCQIYNKYNTVAIITTLRFIARIVKRGFLMDGFLVKYAAGDVNERFWAVLTNS